MEYVSEKIDKSEEIDSSEWIDNSDKESKILMYGNRRIKMIITKDRMLGKF